MEVLVVVKIQANVLARTIFTNALAPSVKMVSTHFLNLLKWTVFSVTVIMEEALRRSVKKRMGLAYVEVIFKENVVLKLVRGSMLPPFII